MAALLLAAALLAAPTAVSVAARAEGSTGNNAGAQTGGRNGTLSALAAGEGTLEGVDLSVAYAPSLHLADQPDFASTTFHSLSLSATRRSSRTVIGFSANGSLGEQDFSPLATPSLVPSAPPATTPSPFLPATRFVSVGYANARLSAGYQFDRRLHGALVGTASTGGRLHAQDSVILPLQRTSSIGAQLSWEGSRLDTFSGTVAGSWSKTLFQGGPQISKSLHLQAEWGRIISRWTRSRLGVGVTLTRNQGSQDAERIPPLPTATGSITTGVPLRGQSLSFTARAETTPVVDTLSGVAYLQGSGGLSAGWSPSHTLSFGASVSAARALYGPVHGWGASGELSASLRLDRQTAFSVGARGAQIPDTALGLDRSGQVFVWTVFAAISAAAREEL